MLKLNTKCKDWLLILLLFSIALIPRLIKLRYFPLWHDELTPDSISGSFTEVINFARKDGTPPFFYVVNIFLKNLSHGDIFVQKLPMVLFSSLSVVIFYDLLKFLKTKHAFLLSLIPATSYILIFYAQDLRFYSYFLFFALLSFYYGFKVFITERRNLIDFVVFAIAIILLPITHYFSIYHLVVLYITLFIFIIIKTKGKEMAEKIIALFGTILISAAGCLLWVDEIVKLKKGIAEIPVGARMYYFDLDLIKNIFYKITGGAELCSAFIFIMLIGLIIFTIYHLITQRKEKEIDWQLFFMFYCFIYLLISLFVFVFLLKSDRILFSRYFIYLIWPILSILCIGLDKFLLNSKNLLKNIVGFTLVGVILISNITNSTLYLLSPYRVENHKEVSDLVDYLMKNKGKNIIYSNRGGISIIDDLNYYLPEDNKIKGLLKDGSEIEPIQEELKRNKNEALFLDFVRYPNLSKTDQKVIASLENIFDNKKILWVSPSVEFLSKRNLHQDYGVSLKKGEYFVAIIFY